MARSDVRWSARLLNALAAVKPGGSSPMTVHVAHSSGAAKTATVTLRAVSESDPSRILTARATATPSTGSFS